MKKERKYKVNIKNQIPMYISCVYIYFYSNKGDVFPKYVLSSYYTYPPPHTVIGVLAGVAGSCHL